MNYPGKGGRILSGPLALLLWLMPPNNAPAQAADLSWLQGSWCMSSGAQAIEEVWLSDVGGNLIGMSRTVADGQVVSFEFMRIETHAGVTRFIAQPGGGAGTEFVATRVSENQLMVENSQHDFPQKIAYQRKAADALTATISGPGELGQEQRIDFNYRACKN